MLGICNMTRQIVLCNTEVPLGKCVEYLLSDDVGEEFTEFKNMTFDESVIARILLQIEELRHLVFIITEVLSATILLIFLLVLVLGWRVNKDRRKQLQTSQQTFINKAYQYDEANNRNQSMQYVYAQESQTQDKKTDFFTVGTQNT